MFQRALLNIKDNWKSWLSVSMITIPLAISVAVASWATPMQGLLTWIWWWIFGAIFASSKHNVLWPASAFSWILLSFSLLHWVEYLPFIAIMAWVMILLMHFLRLTKYVTLIPAAALHWFMFWVWITIAVWQFNAALWLELPKSDKIYFSFLQTLMNANSVNLNAFVMFLIWFLFLYISKLKYPKFPAVIILSIAWIICWYLIKLWYLPHICVLGDKYGWVWFTFYQNIFLPLHIHDFGSFYSIIRKIIGVSFVVAIIAMIETIVTAKIAQKITKEKFSKEKEVMGLALSNIASWMFWGLPAAWAPTRTYLNINSWATGRTSAFIACFLALIFSLLFFNNWFLYFPLPIIAAILINIAIKFMDFWLMKRLYALHHFALYIAVITAFITVVEDPTYWIIIWTSISIMAYLKKITKWGAKVSLFRNGKIHEKLSFSKYLKIQQDGDIVLLKFSWWLNYLNQEAHVEHLEKINKPITLILSFSHMADIDVDWAETIDEVFLTMKNNWVDLYFSWLRWFFQDVISKTKTYKILDWERKILNSTSELLNKLLWDINDIKDNATIPID
ncbi:MAG: hypothetical protein ACD_2C00207G0004 [uncultured bacterium (gcode 4)]|uniref:SLC26A/SulP transporter domain-containing protein n=1 Tax=uncultured bacterium (gcode 4) TaxID=1234023 RepID=K2G1Z6_9BACT|nr:MAG: hypothetical protein ACD_2C00207G0004 [uncultured bacterium (gcode 4)]